MSAAVLTSTTSPTNPLVTALLTDLYQITMCYAHWNNKRHKDWAVFELFFRSNPFNGEYTLFAGLDECLKHLQSTFRFSESDVAFLASLPALQHCETEFFEWLKSVDSSQVTMHAMPDGTVCFPREPLIIVEAPLAVGQLLETTLLTLVNYPSLVATNAARMVRAAQISHQLSHIPGEPVLVEFGLRRAQGPDGGFSASKYAYLGGFAGTSNVLAGKLLGLHVSGTHAHSFVQTYTNLKEVTKCQVYAKKADGSILGVSIGDTVRLLPLVKEYRESLARKMDPAFARTHDGELAAFIAYAAAFPHNFLCLIDTYDTLKSGLLNFLLVALVLDDCGYEATGVRLDSGDLATLSKKCVEQFRKMDREFTKHLVVVATNDINEETLIKLGHEKHAINIYGIGTNLVTCQKQPALGCVYKLVEVDGQPRIKLSQEMTKVLIPRLKRVFRLYCKKPKVDGHALADGRGDGDDGVNPVPILDLMVSMDDSAPQVGVPVVCRHPFHHQERVRVIPAKVQPLLHLVFNEGQVVPGANRDLESARMAVSDTLSVWPELTCLDSPTPYRVAVSQDLFDFFHKLWQKESPMAEYS